MDINTSYKELKELLIRLRAKSKNLDILTAWDDILDIVLKLKKYLDKRRGGLDDDS